MLGFKTLWLTLGIAITRCPALSMYNWIIKGHIVLFISFATHLYVSWMTSAVVDTFPGGEVFGVFFSVALCDSLFPSLDSSKDSISLLMDDGLLFFATGVPVLTNVVYVHRFCTLDTVSITTSWGSSIWASRDDSLIVFACFWFFLFMSTVCVELLLL